MLLYQQRFSFCGLSKGFFAIKVIVMFYSAIFKRAFTYTNNAEGIFNSFVSCRFRSYSQFYLFMLLKAWLCKGLKDSIFINGFNSLGHLDHLHISKLH